MIKTSYENGNTCQISIRKELSRELKYSKNLSRPVVECKKKDCCTPLAPILETGKKIKWSVGSRRNELPAVQMLWLPKKMREVLRLLAR